MSAENKMIAAFVAAQAEMTGARKSSENPHFRSKYADLEAVQDACIPALRAHGFAVYQPSGRDDFGDYVETVFHHESGERITGRTYLVVDKNNMQGVGSAITYARRYGLMGLAGIAPEDDDGNAAAAAPPPKREPRKPDIGKRRDEILAHIKTVTDLDELKAFWVGIAKEVAGMNANGFAEMAAQIEAAKDSKKAELIAELAEERAM